MQTEEQNINEEQELYENYRIEVEKGQKILRIDKYLMMRIEGTSRNKIQTAAKAGCVKVNNAVVKSNYRRRYYTDFPHSSSTRDRNNTSRHSDRHRLRR